MYREVGIRSVYTRRYLVHFVQLTKGLSRRPSPTCPLALALDLALAVSFT